MLTEPFTLIPVQNTQVTAAVHGLTFRNFESPLSRSQSSEPHAVYWDMLWAKRLRNGCPLTRWASRISGA